mgnify:CR=1 FL=1
MVLLTSSTVSVILSSGVVCIFTLLLFLSGYTLQQQSVRNIQHALRPPPGPLGAGEGYARDSSRSSYKDHDQNVLPDLEFLNSRTEEPHHASSTSNGNYAYLQLLSHPDPSDICSAIAFFKHLSTNGSAIPDRLFMYPQEWDQAKHPPPRVATALSLLRAASVKYGIWLLPIDMSAATSAGYTPTDTKLLRLGQIQFMQYDSVLDLQSPGMLLDTGKLDAMMLSRPLPMRYDKKRRESYNNEAWIPMPLRADRDAQLPPVYLIAVNNIGRGHVEARGHIPNIALPDFGRLVTGPWGVKSTWDKEYDHDELPGYVFFESDKDGHVRWAGNPLFGAWRAQQYEVCEGLDLDDDVSHDEG